MQRVRRVDHKQSTRAQTGAGIIGNGARRGAAAVSHIETAVQPRALAPKGEIPEFSRQLLRIEAGDVWVPDHVRPSRESLQRIGRHFDDPGVIRLQLIARVAEDKAPA